MISSCVTLQLLKRRWKATTAERFDVNRLITAVGLVMMELKKCSPFFPAAYR